MQPSRANDVSILVPLKKSNNHIKLKKYLVNTCIAYESRLHIMRHVKWPSSSFKVDLDHENDTISKNGFYQRILQPSEHPKRERA